MRIFVTGGAGFIGSHVSQKLLGRGHEVTIFDNLSTGHRENIPALSTLVEGDIRDGKTLLKASGGHDAIIHLAASVGNVKSIEDPITDASVNILGTRNVCQAAIFNKIPVLVYASSSAVYGTPQYLPIDEKHPCEPDSPYGVSKLAGEKDVLCLSRIHGFRSVCVRPFNVFGVNQRYDVYGNVIPIFFQRILNSKPLVIYGDGNQTRDFVDVSDVADVFVTAVEREQCFGVFNVASGVSSTVNDLVKHITEVVGRSLDIEYAPPRKGEVIHSSANITNLLSIVGHRPLADLEASLRLYWDWFQKTHG